ncbi:MAG: hypothetical protein KJP02_04490 [Octadecabacter sp.]|nr:hypothetical protein [Octadecabacter sp.]
MPANDTHDEWVSLIDQLRGSIDMLSSYPDGVEELLDNMEFCKLLDQHIFSCDACGWWCDISEEASDDYDLPALTCRDCCEEAKEQADG